MRGGDCPASRIAVVGTVDRPRICINALAIDRVAAQGSFWPALADHQWVCPGAGTLMPFGLGNSTATYRRLQQAMLMPCLLGHAEEEEEMLRPSEGPEPGETADP